MVDASNVAVGATHQQQLANHTQPLDFISRKLLPAETHYSTFERELLAVYLPVKHIRHFLEDRDFTVFTDHKPLSFTLKFTSDKLNHRKIHQLDCISQFTSDIRHIDGSRNEVAVTLSGPSIAHHQPTHGIVLAEMAVGSPCNEDVSAPQLQHLPLTAGNDTIVYNVSTTFHRPFVPPSLRLKVFSSLHNLSHPGSRVTEKLFSGYFVWTGPTTQQSSHWHLPYSGRTVPSCSPGHLRPPASVQWLFLSPYLRGSIHPLAGSYSPA
nr:unnamed protein product [Spirometra erinaceieuropaei]